MRTVLLTACVLAGAGAVGARPQSPAAVTVDVAVADSRGRPVTGLAAADFTVELDGRPARILSIAYLAAGPPMMGAVGPVFDAATPAAPVYRTVVEAPPDTAPGREFGVAVAVARPGAQARTAERAIAAAGSPGTTRRSTPPNAVPASTADRLRNAIATGRPERGLAIRLGRALRRGPDPAQLLLAVQIEIAAPARPPISTLLGVVDGRGAIRTAGQDIAAALDGGVYRLDFSLPLVPGPYKLRFAAADAAGTIGAVESAVSMELAAMGPFRASDLLRWTVGADNQPRPLILEELPSGASSIGASLELYRPGGAEAMHDLLVKMTLAPAAEDAPAAIERIVAPEAREGLLVAEAEFPLQRLGPGTYVLRAEVQSGATVLGTATATVIKR